MKRTVRREIIDEWIDEAYPDALTKLANASLIPASSLSKIRSGRVPKNRGQRVALAKAIGTTENKLFPVLQDGKEQAS